MSSNNSDESTTKQYQQQQHQQHNSAANGVTATVGNTAATGTRNKRVYFDVETKMHTLNRIDKGEAKSAIIREMHLPPSTLATWIKDRHRILELYRHSLGRRKRLRRQGVGSAAKTAAPIPVVEVVDPSTAAPYLGGPFVTPCALAAEAATPSTPDGGSHGNNGEDYSEDGEDDGDEESGENLNNHDLEEDEDEHKMTLPSLLRPQQPPPPPPPLQQQPVLGPTTATATIAIPVMRRAPQVVLPRPLVARSVTTAAAGPSVLSSQHPQQLPQQQPSVTLGLGPPPQPPQQMPQAQAVSLGAFLTTGIATAHHHQQQQQHHQLQQHILQHSQQPQQQPQPQQIQMEPPLTRAVMEELLQRYVAQMSAILTFTISPMQNSIEQIAQLLAEVRQGQLLARSRRDEAKARWDWLENTRQHPTEPEKVLLAWDTSYETAVPREWIGECCDTEPDRTLANLLRKALGSREKLQQLLPNLAEDRVFRALRHYVTFTQGPVSKDFCKRVAQQTLEDWTN